MWGEGVIESKLFKAHVLTTCLRGPPLYNSQLLGTQQKLLFSRYCTGHLSIAASWCGPKEWPLIVRFHSTMNSVVSSLVR